MSIARYQDGSIVRVRRAKGPDVWVYRFRSAADADGNRKHYSRILGSVKDYPKKADAKRAAENLRVEINAAEQKAGRMTVRDAWGHFQLYELHNPNVGRTPSTIAGYLDYFKSWILPHWGDTALDDVRAVKMESWLGSLDLAPASKAKIRNLLSSLFSHCIRHELYTGSNPNAPANPMSSVRQSAKRLKEPETFTIEEMSAIIQNITKEPVKVMVMVAAATALRRSEIRGLKWRDLDLDGYWIHLKRGLVRKDQLSNLKTEASRRGLPMLPELANVLREWRKNTPYPADEDWVFASPFTEGERPYWPESAMVDYVRPAAKKAKITKHVNWHAFRHSLGTIMKAKGEDVKTIQELLRHANSRITLDVYTHGDTNAKRNALSNVTGLFVVKAAA
jgi:integrase